jgi:hypothetical protein
MSDRPDSENQDFERELKAYFNVTTGTELPRGIQQANADNYADAKPAAMARIMSGIGVVLVGAVAVGAVITLRSTSSHSTPSLAVAPAIADGAAIAYDPAIKKVVLFGGHDANGRSLSDTWAWDGTNWVKLSPATSPPARQGAALGWDPAGQRLVLTGGVAVATATASAPVTTCTTGSGPVPPPAVTAAPGAAGSGGGQAQSVQVQGGQVSSGAVVTSGGISGEASSVSVSAGSASPPPPGTSVSGSISINASGAVTSKTVEGCTTGAAVTGLHDTWTFDGSNWHQEHPSTNPPVALGRALMATDDTTGSLLLVTPSLSPQVLDTSRACPAPAAAATASGPVTCAGFAGPANDVYVWKGGNWVAAGTIAGSVSMLATDPSTGDVTAVMAPTFAFSCGVAGATAISASTSTTASGTTAITTAPCRAGADVKSQTEHGTELMEWSGGKWTPAGASGAPASPVALATADSQAGYLLVITTDGQTWSFAHNAWSKLATSGPPSAALGLAQLADDPGNDSSSVGQVLMFITAPGLEPQPENGSAALIPAPSKGATSDATWIWNGSWKQVAGAAWPAAPSTTPPAPVPCPAAAANAAPSPPPGAVTVCNGDPSAGSGASLQIQPAAATP